MAELEPRAEEPNAGMSPGAAPGFRILPLDRRFPLVTVLLIGANLAMAGAEFVICGFRWTSGVSSAAAKFVLGEKLASLIEHGEYWRLIAANFIHAEFFHLAGNMVALFVLGRWIEALYGRSRTFVIFTLACVGGMLASYKLTPGMSVGASTGIFGLLGALIAHNLRYQRYLPLRMARRTSWLLFFLGLLMLWSTFRPDVDSYGHFGGLLAGAVMGLLLSGRIAGEEQRNRDSVPLPTAVATAAALLAYGLFGLISSLPSEAGLLEAARARGIEGQIAGFEATIARKPYFLEARLQLFDLLADARRPAEAAAVLGASTKPDEIARIMLVRSAVATQKQEWDPAVEYARVALRTARDPALRALAGDQVAGILFDRSTDAFQKEQWDQAVEYGRLALRDVRAPALRADADNQVAWTLADRLMRDLDEAEREAREAVQLESDNAAFADTLAWTLYREGKYPEALKEQETAVNLDGQGSAMTGLKRLIDPAARAQRAELYYHLGAIQEKLGHLPEAIAAYTRASHGIGANRNAIAALQRLRGNPAPSGSASGFTRPDQG